MLIHYSLCLHQPGLHKWKVKISSKCLDLNCDPDQWKRSFPSFVDKLPNRFPVFNTLLDMNFPRLRPHFHMGHFTRDATGDRLSCGCFTLKRGTGSQIKDEENWCDMNHVNAAFMGENVPTEENPAGVTSSSCSHTTWGVCVSWRMENIVVEQRFLETSDRKGSGYNSHCRTVTSKMTD